MLSSNRPFPLDRESVSPAMAEKKRRNGKSVVEVDSTERVLKQIFEVRCRCRNVKIWCLAPPCELLTSLPASLRMQLYNDGLNPGTAGSIGLKVSRH